MTASGAQAGAFQLNERSAKGMGTSLAGTASAASDVTFATFNPAALTTVENFEIGGNVSVVAPISDGTFTNGPFAGQEFDADRTGVVPAFAAGFRVNEDLVVGLTSYAPFGLKTEYPTFWPGMVDGRTSELRTVVIAPTIAYDVLDNLTFGASLDILYADARLTSAAVNLDGSQYSVSFSFGALYEPLEGTRIGAAYHHGYELDFNTAIFGGLAGGIPETAGITGVAKTELPNWVQIGVTQDVGEDLRVMLEGRWINWSRFDRIDVSATNAPGLAFSDVQNYDDAFFVSLGAEYDISRSFTLRGGVAWDETPTSDAFRTVRVPDEDRLWLSLGASYRLTDSMSIDAAYSYLHALDDPDVTLQRGPLAGTSLQYDGGAHIFSIGGTLRF
ncbi:outer membrane protein transport protein [Limibaculum sp. FT325]|uniref:OmpP1/FadL family transporter n=1 Tax=Thermohalobaculum sediminis TaxID=2939436 RepID=UPI0020C136AC|nr:outer membrane protein transport protein [Limibaculum sediminis]MCL5778720.1 outer membrane protein transport protein [Limibaculum sediminis]